MLAHAGGHARQAAGARASLAVGDLNVVRIADGAQRLLTRGSDPRMRLRAIQEAERILLGRLQDPPPGHFTLDASCELLGLDRQWLLDARRDLARTEAVLRQAGLRRGRRGPRGRPQSGWPSLSPAEQAVASLVADGLTNPQIGDRLYISRRIVQTHLVHIFAKLDLASRAQLAAEVTRHQ